MVILKKWSSNKLSLGITKILVLGLYVFSSCCSGIVENLLLESDQKSLLKYGVALTNGGAIFERFDRDRSGKIDATELRDALYSIGFALPPWVLQLLISRYDYGSGRRRVELNFDSFVESGMIVKGLTEKFKKKDPGYKGSATLTYDTFISMLIPFLVSD